MTDRETIKILFAGCALIGLIAGRHYDGLRITLARSAWDQAEAMLKTVPGDIYLGEDVTITSDNEGENKHNV